MLLKFLNPCYYERVQADTISSFVCERAILAIDIVPACVFFGPLNVHRVNELNDRNGMVD